MRAIGAAHEGTSTSSSPKNMSSFPCCTPQAPKVKNPPPAKLSAALHTRAHGGNAPVFQIACTFGVLSSISISLFCSCSQEKTAQRRVAVAMVVSIDLHTPAARSPSSELFSLLIGFPRNPCAPAARAFVCFVSFS